MSCFGGGGGAPEEDPTESRRKKQHSQEIDQDLQRYKREFESTHRLLLLGEEEGRSAASYAHILNLHTYVRTYVCPATCDCDSVHVFVAEA